MMIIKRHQTGRVQVSLTSLHCVFSFLWEVYHCLATWRDKAHASFAMLLFWCPMYVLIMAELTVLATVNNFVAYFVDPLNAALDSVAVGGETVERVVASFLIDDPALEHPLRRMGTYVASKACGLIAI
jgi:hypothetical protein